MTILSIKKIENYILIIVNFSYINCKFDEIISHILSIILSYLVETSLTFLIIYTSIPECPKEVFKTYIQITFFKFKCYYFIMG